MLLRAEMDGEAKKLGEEVAVLKKDVEAAEEISRGKDVELEQLRDELKIKTNEVNGLEERIETMRNEVDGHKKSTVEKTGEIDIYIYMYA